MKKIIMTTALLAGAFITSTASAAALDQSGNLIVGQAVANAQCALLGSTVNPNLSANVHAAYRCREAVGEIRVGACHEGGSRAPLTTQCVSTTDLITGAVTWNDATCTAATDTFELVDRRYYSMTSEGGSIAAATLGGGAACDDAAVATKIAL